MKFTTKNILIDGNYDSRYVWYIGGGEKLFMARFKHVRPAANANHFAKFVRDNYTVAQFFELQSEDALVDNMKQKGYLSYNTTQTLIRRGFPVNLDGLNHMIRTNRKKEGNLAT